MTLYLYFARRFATTFILIFGAFFLFYALVDMIDLLRRPHGAEAGFGKILVLTALDVPEGLYRILPLITILATLVLFLGFSRSNELVVARASGRSALRSLMAPVGVALLTGVLAITVLNPIVAATSKRFEILSAEIRGNVASVISVNREGLWLRQGDAGGQTVIRAARANQNGTELTDVTFYGLDPDGLPRFRVEAESAELEEGAWVAHRAKVWTFSRGVNAEKAAETLETYRVESDLTREEITDGFGAPSSIPIWELPGQIDRLEHAGFSARRHRVWFQTELAKPLFLAAMVMIGAGFTMRHARAGRTGVMILLALGMGFAVYFVQNFAVVLGENGQLPVLLAAWAPPVAAILLALALVLHMEDG